MRTIKYLFSKIILILFFAICFLSCSNNSNCRCCDYLSTNQISNGIYVERYRTYCGGVLGGDVVSSYITDSVSFRVKVGNQDDHNKFIVIENNGTYFGLLYEIRIKEVIEEKKSFPLSSLSFSELDTTNFMCQPLVGDLFFTCNKHSDFHEYTYSINNSHYSVKGTQFQCKSNGKFSYINAYYLINQENKCLLMYNYDMAKWSKGKSHYKYFVDEKSLLITKYDNIQLIDTIEYKKIDLVKLKNKSMGNMESPCN